MGTRSNHVTFDDPEWPWKAEKPEGPIFGVDLHNYTQTIWPMVAKFDMMIHMGSDVFMRGSATDQRSQIFETRNFKNMLINWSYDRSDRFTEQNLLTLPTTYDCGISQSSLILRGSQTTWQESYYRVHYTPTLSKGVIGSIFWPMQSTTFDLPWMLTRVQFAITTLLVLIIPIYSAQRRCKNRRITLLMLQT